jgi:hypothetical protein
VVDKHARQYELRLEKHWVTQNFWFRIVTTIVGMCVVDCWKAYHHTFGDKEFTVCKFAEQVAFKMINNNFEDSTVSIEVLSPLDRSTPRRSPRKAVTVTNEVSEISSLMDTLNGRGAARNEWLWMEMMQLHPHEKSFDIDKNGYPKRNRYKECLQKTPWIFTHCKVFLCSDSQGKSSNKCYRKHVHSKHPRLKLKA